MKPSEKRINDAADNFLIALRAATKGEYQDARPYALRFARDLISAVEDRYAERCSEAMTAAIEKVSQLTEEGS